MLRQSEAVNRRELQRLRGDLTAYRQEAQTVGRQKVMYGNTSDIPAAAKPPPPVAERKEAEEPSSDTEPMLRPRPGRREKQEKSLKELRAELKAMKRPQMSGQPQKAVREYAQSQGIDLFR
jgi:hypothetical protein